MPLSTTFRAMKVLHPRLAATFLLCIPAIASAVTIPYTENFDDETLGTSTPSEPAPESGQFVVSSSAAWRIVQGSAAGNLAFENAFTTTGSSSATINFAGALGGGLKTDFIISTEFKLDTFTVTNSNITVGFGALGVNSTLTGDSTNPFYVADFLVNEFSNKQDIGRIRIHEVGGDGELVRQITTISINSTDTYRMTLQGIYAGSALGLTFTVENLTANQSATVTATDLTPTTGTYFGYRNRINGGGSLDVDFDNFSVTAVPEPTSAALLGAGLLGLMARRRRK